MPVWLRSTDSIRKPGLWVRLLMLVVAIAAPIAFVYGGEPLVTDAVQRFFHAQDVADTLARRPLEVRSTSDVLDAVLVIYLAFGALLGLIGGAIRAFVHDLKGVGKAWDGAGKFLAVTAALMVTLAALVRFGDGPGQYLNLLGGAGALLIAALFAWGLYGLARWVQHLEG
jgi:hypothetical protein